MARISFMVAHEQVSSRDLLKDVKHMEEAGFERCWSSDHYMPWWHTGASGGATWPWLGAALARTDDIQVGTSVTAPILRYNPAIVAQVFATLDHMFPGRTFLTVGTGESLNEVPAGYEWPSSKERLGRLEEAIQIIRKLWTEEWVDFEGTYYNIEKSNLYTKPETEIPLYVAAMGSQAAELAGAMGDGLVTNEGEPALIRERLLPAFERGAKRANKDPESMLKAIFIPASYDEDKQKALEAIGYWRGAMIKAFFDANYPDPRKIEENGQVVGNDAMEKSALVISSAEEGIKKLQKYVDLGFTDIVLINSSPDRASFIELVAQEVAPAIEGARVAEA
jgi:coenzyme F420-dependent glucose-6-phosphate dehydrogenase